MEFINPNIMIPLQWCHYGEYCIYSLEDYLAWVSPQTAEQNKASLLEAMREEFPMEAEELWPSILKKEIICPTPGANFATYNAWDFTKPDSFVDFASLWRYDTAPSPGHILGWAKEYGLPCETPFSKTLSSYWGYSAVHTNLPQDQIIAQRLSRILSDLFKDERLDGNKIIRKGKLLIPQRGADEVLLKNADLFYSSRHSMFVSTFHALSLEASLANKILSGLLAGSPYKNIDKVTQKNLRGLLMQDEYIERDLASEWFDDSIKEVQHIKEWRVLRELVVTKLNGLTMSIRAKSVAKSPKVELRYAYKAEDLLAVMWIRFYEQMVALGPTDLCPVCEKFFRKTQSNKIYCSRTCSGRARVKKFRSKGSDGETATIDDGE